MNLLSWLGDALSSGGSSASGSRGGCGKGVYVPDPLGRLGQGTWRSPVTLSQPFGKPSIPEGQSGALPDSGVWNVGDITLTGPVGMIGDNRPNDVAKVETRLGQTGHLDLGATDGPTGYFGARTEQAVKRFQKDHGLNVDGRLNPGGETIRALGTATGVPVVAQAQAAAKPESSQSLRSDVAFDAFTPPVLGHHPSGGKELLVFPPSGDGLSAKTLPATGESSAPRTLLQEYLDPKTERLKESPKPVLMNTATTEPAPSVRLPANVSPSIPPRTGGSDDQAALTFPPRSTGSDAHSGRETPDNGDDEPDFEFDGDFEADFSLGAQDDGGEEGSSFVRPLIENYNDEWLAIQQGTSPIVQALDGTFNYERAPSGEQGFFAETGQVTDSGKYVVLRDPETGKLAVWNRNPEMDEGRAMRLGRMLGAGLLTDPIRVGKVGRIALRGSRGLSGLASAATKANARFGQWVDDIQSARQARAVGKPFDKSVPRMVRVGVLEDDVQRFVRNQGISPATADITATDKGIFHLTRQAKAQAGKALPLDAVKRMPEVLGSPSAVLWDKNKKNLSYVFDVPGDPKKGKFVVTVNFHTRARIGADGKRTIQTINNVTTGGMVSNRNLSDTNTYEVIKGKL